MLKKPSWPANSGPVALALALLLLAVPPASARDIGIPRDGLDRVLTDDGRVLEAKVAPGEKGEVRLEFPAGSIVVPEGRLVSVRLWKDFDPQPRDDDERAKTAEGFLRWGGRLVAPSVWEKNRNAEIEKERESRSPPLPFEKAEVISCGKFEFKCNLEQEDISFHARHLEALSRKMVDALPGAGQWVSTSVHLYRTEEEWQAQKAEDEVHHKRLGKYANPWDTRRVNLVAGNLEREEVLARLLDLSAIYLFLDLVGWQADDLGGWVRCGVPTYFASFKWEKKQFRVGAVNDDFLWSFREMARKGTLPKFDEILQAGNDYWKDSFESGRGFRSPSTDFETRHVPCSWMLVHFILEGEKGKYRGGLVNWIRFWQSAKDGKRVDASASFADTKKRLMAYLKVTREDKFLESMMEYANGLEYRNPRSMAKIATSMAGTEGGPDHAMEVLAKALELGRGDPVALRMIGESAAALPQGREFAAKALLAAVEEDPLDAKARTALAGVLAGEDANREKALAQSLAGIPDSR